jgi:hypothetical protein
MHRVCGPSARCSSGADTFRADSEGLHVPELDTGFRLLYELNPVEARAQFETWQKSNAQD